MIEEDADDEVKDAGLIAAAGTSLSVLDAWPRPTAALWAIATYK